MAGTPDPGGPQEPTLYVAEYLLRTAREDLARADTKASVLLSGALALPALLLGGNRWSSAPAGGWLLPLAAGACLWATGTALLVWTILPRTGTSRTGPGVTFYADARTAAEPRALVPGVTEAGRDRVGWLLTQFVDVSLILTAKYRCLRWGVCCLLPGLLLTGAALAAA